MKRITFYLILLVFTLALVGCNDKQDDNGINGLGEVPKKVSSKPESKENEESTISKDKPLSLEDEEYVNHVNNDGATALMMAENETDGAAIVEYLISLVGVDIKSIK